MIFGPESESGLRLSSVVRVEGKTRSLATDSERCRISEISAIGVSFRTAPVAVRESLSLNSEEIRLLLKRFKSMRPEVGLVALSTCNRSEFYMSNAGEAAVVDELIEELKRLKAGGSISNATCRFYQESGENAVLHVFRVACGLDSAIIGDVQILGQFKDAIRMARLWGSMGTTLERIVSGAIRAAKRARSESAIGSGSAGLGSTIAAILAKRKSECGSPETKSRVLVLGAGDIAREVGRNLLKSNTSELVFCNRSFGKAEKLASDFDGSSVPWGDLEKNLAHCDCVVAATGSPVPILNRKMLSKLLRTKCPLLIDAGVPRNIEPIEGLDLIDIDSIELGREKTFAARTAAVPLVESIIREELESCRNWSKQFPLEQALGALFREGRSLGRTLSESVSNDSGHDQPSLESVFTRGIELMLGEHARRMRALERGAR